MIKIKNIILIFFVFILHGCFLIDQNKLNSKLWSAVSLQNYNKVKLYTKLGANLNSEPTNTFTILTKASMEGDIKIVKFLIDHGAKVNKFDDENLISPLMIACQYGHKDIVKLLIQNEAEINLQNKNGITALMFAINGIYEDKRSLIINELLKINGINLNLKNKDNKNALDIAKENNFSDLIEILSKP